MRTTRHYWYQSVHWPSQLLRFGLVGSSGLVIGLTTLNGVMLAVGNFVLANGVAFVAAVTWNFILNRQLTFEPSCHPLTRQWAAFVFGSAGGTAINWMVSLPLYYSHPFFEQHYNFAVLIGVAAGGGCNFLWARKVVFIPQSGAFERAN